MKNSIRSQVDADLSRITWTVRNQNAVLNRIRKGGLEPVKKKVSFATVLALAVLLIGVTVSVAEMLGLNVFELFGQTDERYQEIAPYTVLEKTSEVSVTTVKSGKLAASINSAYYDGQSLMVGYAIQNDIYLEEFTPDDARLSKMTKVEDPYFPEPDTEEEEILINRWNQAKTHGTPMGIIIYSINPSDRTVTDDGVDIPPFMEDTRKGEDRLEYTIREYEAPLEEALRNLDYLTLNIHLCQSASWYYFDGTDVYSCYEWQNLEPMKATVWNTHAEIKAFEGHGQFNGVDYDVLVHASAVNALFEMSFGEVSLPKLPDKDHWYVFHLTDESGKTLRINEYDDTNPSRMRLVYEGTGKVPSKLTLRIYIGQEGAFEKEAAIREATPVPLNPRK